jgi:GntR family transcriptional regulator, vanillate catabolism transcriptional regulator
MASQIDRVISELRQRILSGRLRAGERVLEVQYAAELGVSRTPLRLALGELEKQGLLERLPTRGYRVRSFSLHEVAMALEVRGTLEGMAARLAAEAGVGTATLQTLQDCVQSGRSLLERARQHDTPFDAAGWAEMNARFHATLVTAAGNPALSSSLENLGRIPMVKPGELWVGSGDPQLTLGFIERAQFDHEDVVHAIAARQGARAEVLMREHARRSAENKRALAATSRGDTLTSIAAAVPSL